VIILCGRYSLGGVKPDNFGPLICKGQSYRTPDTARRAGYQGMLSGQEVTHLEFLCRLLRCGGLIEEVSSRMRASTVPLMSSEIMRPLEVTATASQRRRKIRLKLLNSICFEIDSDAAAHGKRPSRDVETESWRQRRTKEGATDMFSLPPPRHITTLARALLRTLASDLRMSGILRWNGIT
jgi:hypothetical protein